MAANRVRKFRTLDELQAFLNGGIEGGNVQRAAGPPGNNAPGIGGLVGLTLIFSSPSSVTVTFAASSTSNPDSHTLLFTDIKSQIETAIPAVKVVMSMDGRIVLVEATPTSGVAVTAAGTANSLLGFDGGNDTIGKFYKPVEVSNTAPCWVWTESGNDNMHSVFTWE